MRLRSFALVIAAAIASLASCAEQPPPAAPPPPAPTALPAASAPPAPPAAPSPEALGRAYLDALNAGDRARLKAFFEAHHPPALEHLDDEISMRDATGGFEWKRVEESTPLLLKALLKERDSDAIVRLEIEASAEKAGAISKLTLRLIPAPPDLAVPRLDEAAALAAFAAELKRAAAADRFSGAALVAKDGKVIFTAAHGLADRQARVDNKLDTQFRLGSMNKMFTAVAILQLVQKKRVDLRAPLRTYLPDYPNKDLAAKVTLHHLLTHTGGTGDIFGPEYDKHRQELKTLDDYLKLYGTRALEFEPGTSARYSNYGFILLGAVIEKVTRRSYYDHVRASVLLPAGMRSSDSLPEEVSVPRRARGYTTPGAPGSGWQLNTDSLPYRGTSAGGGYSTVEDLLRFSLALQSHKLLDDKHTELLITPKPSPGRNRLYGYGIATEDLSGVRCYGHGGGAPGMNGELYVCPKEGYVVAVLSNLDPPAAERAATFVLNRLPLR